MNFLSQAFVNEKEVRNRRIGDCYRWHCSLWDALADDRHDEGRDRVGFLFRIDRLGKKQRVLVLSERIPSSMEWLTWQTTKVEPGFLGAEQYRFQLKVNPTVKRTKLGKDKKPTKNGRRTGIYEHQELLEWMQRKASQSGFETTGQLDYAGPVDEFFVKRGRRGKLVSVDFRGVLRVVERSRFTKAFAHGIGSAKGFGFGMLMLQPIA